MAAPLFNGAQVNGAPSVRLRQHEAGAGGQPRVKPGGRDGGRLSGRPSPNPNPRSILGARAGPHLSPGHGRAVLWSWARARRRTRTQAERPVDALGARTPTATRRSRTAEKERGGWKEAWGAGRAGVLLASRAISAAWTCTGAADRKTLNRKP